MRLPIGLVTILVCACTDDSAGTAQFEQGGSESAASAAAGSESRAGASSAPATGGASGSSASAGSAGLIGGGSGSSSGGESSAGNPSGASGAGKGGASESGLDPFGVRKIQPTKPGGREWYLPETAETSDGEWGGKVSKTDEAGVFHVEGSPRLVTSSPTGKPWWQNVEITAYYRLHGTVTGSDIAPGWQLYARSERHSIDQLEPTSINLGRPAPAGTPAWPGYPFSEPINGHCLGSSYKAYLDVKGTMRFKKEIAHISGYTGARDTKTPFADGLPRNQWIGFKALIRNAGDGASVHMESWLDRNADGSWEKMSEVDDTGGWQGGSSNPDGCGAPPFNYADDQLVTWAGPFVSYRFDNLSSDLKWLSAREIDPLP
jgi:hypothetical protein